MLTAPTTVGPDMCTQPAESATGAHSIMQARPRIGGLQLVPYSAVRAPRATQSKKPGRRAYYHQVKHGSPRSANEPRTDAEKIARSTGNCTQLIYSRPQKHVRPIPGIHFPIKTGQTGLRTPRGFPEFAMSGQNSTLPDRNSTPPTPS